ncbi:uncharacterized protein LOC128888795 [Hylaeus anthracinus]|uniref:uncharacterized protein LOC128888795 n=1 Tax=Hylaeus anthracinus TaxID=313031 RepID=UPI0023B89620|nr:uncharacterized protein LOC128888795 [Hylaeus anthracinus]
MGSNRIESFDVSRKAREVIEWRSLRRKQLRQEYLKQILNPIKQQTVMDDATTRFAVMRIAHEYQAKLTARSFFVGVCGLTTLFGAIMYGFVKLKESEENEYRTGKVSYANREFKFK